VIITYNRNHIKKKNSQLSLSIYAHDTNYLFQSNVTKNATNMIQVYFYVK